MLMLSRLYCSNLGLLVSLAHKSCHSHHYYYSLLKPELQEIGYCLRRYLSRARRLARVLAGKPAGERGRSHTLSSVGHVDGPGEHVHDAVGGRVVREAGLDGLVDVQHVGHPVPAPGVEYGRVGVVADDAGPVVPRHGLVHAGHAGTALEPYRQRSGGRIGARLEEPEEDVALLVGQGDVATVGMHSRGRLADICLLGMLATIDLERKEGRGSDLPPCSWL